MIDPIRLCTSHGEFHARDLNAVMGQQPWDLVHFTYASTGTRRAGARQSLATTGSPGRCFSRNGRRRADGCRLGVG
jgi:hypothetical protein